MLKLAIFVALALVLGCASARPLASEDCPQSAPLADADFVALVNSIKAASMSDDKNKILDVFCANQTRGFSSQQTVKLLQFFTFSSNMVKAINTMSPKVLGCTTAQVVEVLNSFSFSNDRLTVLPAIMGVILDAENKGMIVDKCFTFSGDKAAASKILDGLIPRSCVFGTVTEPRVQFLIDVSGSMGDRMQNEGSDTTSRLTYVRDEILTVLTKQLRPGQIFNVLSFSAGVTAWQPGLVPVNDTSIQSAAKFCNGLTANGGTNIYGALEVAFRDPQVYAIYLLTDGFPSVGVTDPTQIVKFAQQTAAKFNPNVVINTIALTSGGKESPAEKEKARLLMSQLAEVTGGVYRNLN